MRPNLSETVTYTACVSYGFPNLIKNYGNDLLFFCFCEIFNFIFNFVMRHYWAKAYLFMPQIAGYTSLLGHGHLVELCKICDNMSENMAVFTKYWYLHPISLCFLGLADII